MALSTASSVGYTKYTAGGMSNFISQHWNHDVLCVHDEYTVPAATLADPCIVSIGRMPKGSRVLFSFITYSAASAAVIGTLKVGSTTVGAVTSMTAAGSQYLPVLIAAAGTATTAEAAVTFTTSGAVAPAAMNFTVSVFYIQDGIGA